MEKGSTTDSPSGYWTIVRSDKVRKQRNFSCLSEETEYVHISGSPHVWIIEAILDQAPNLKTLQINQVFEGTDIGERTVHICRQKGVKVGYGSILVGTREDRNQASTRYKQHRAFLQSLPLEKRLEIKELCRLGLKEALLTSRYYCLEGEEYIRIGEVASEVFGEKKCAPISIYLSAFMKYLDPSIEVKPCVARAYRWMIARMDKLKAMAAVTGRLQSVAKNDDVNR